ncbi:MAG: hypothetical protein V7K70_12290 [Nostoc sp.]
MIDYLLSFLLAKLSDISKKLSLRHYSFEIIMGKYLCVIFLANNGIIMVFDTN